MAPPRIDEQARERAYQAAALRTPHAVDRDQIDDAIDAYLKAPVPQEAIDAVVSLLDPVERRSSTSEGVCDGCGARVVPVSRSQDETTERVALRVAADDLDKAANQFDGLGYQTDAERFAAKAERARAVVAGEVQANSKDVQTLGDEAAASGAGDEAVERFAEFLYDRVMAERKAFASSEAGRSFFETPWSGLSLSQAQRWRDEAKQALDRLALSGLGEREPREGIDERLDAAVKEARLLRAERDRLKKGAEDLFAAWDGAPNSEVRRHVEKLRAALIDDLSDSHERGERTVAALGGSDSGPEPEADLGAFERAIWGEYCREHPEAELEPDHWPDWLIGAALKAHDLASQVPVDAGAGVWLDEAEVRHVAALLEMRENLGHHSGCDGCPAQTALAKCAGAGAVDAPPDAGADQQESERWSVLAAAGALLDCWDEFGGKHLDAQTFVNVVAESVEHLRQAVAIDDGNRLRAAVSSSQTGRERFDPDWRVPPGETIKELLNERGWDAVSLAGRLGWREREVQYLLEGTLPVTEAFAQKLEKIFGVPANFWLNREAEYRRPQSGREPEEGERFDDPPLLAAFAEFVKHAYDSGDWTTPRSPAASLLPLMAEVAEFIALGDLAVASDALARSTDYQAHHLAKLIDRRLASSLPVQGAGEAADEFAPDGIGWRHTPCGGHNANRICTKCGVDGTRKRPAQGAGEREGDGHG